MALIVLATLGLAPAEAMAGCTFGQSRIPAATSPSPKPAPAYRANMLRTAKAPPAKPRPAVKRKPRPQVAANTTPRPHVHRKRKPAVKMAARPAAPTPAAPAGRPTPLAQAQWEAATPKAYALIETTICENEPGTRLAMLRTPPEEAAAPDQGVELPLTPPGEDVPVVPGTDLQTFPPAPPPGGPGIVIPGTPGQPPAPPFEPPVGPGPPIVSAVPEPSTWLMMIFGFGLTGALIRRQAARARRGSAAA